MSLPFNYYEILDVPADATQNEITKAYRRLSKTHHPDHTSEENKTAETTYSKILNEAYNVLSDPVERQRYDESGYRSKVDAPPPPPKPAEEPPVLVVQVPELLRKTELEIGTTHRTELIIENQGGDVAKLNLSYTPHDEWLEIVSVQKLREREAQVIIIINTRGLKLNQLCRGSITITIDQAHTTIPISFQIVPSTRRGVSYTPDDDYYSAPPPSKPSPDPGPTPTPVDTSTWRATSPPSIGEAIWLIVSSIHWGKLILLIGIVAALLWFWQFSAELNRDEYANTNAGQTATTAPSNASTSITSDTTNINLQFNQVLYAGNLRASTSSSGGRFRVGPSGAGFYGDDIGGSDTFAFDCDISDQRVINSFGTYSKSYIAFLNVPTEYVTQLANGWFVSVSPNRFGERETTTSHHRPGGGYRYTTHIKGSYIVTISDQNPTQSTELFHQVVQFSIDCQGRLTQYQSEPRRSPLSHIIFEYNANTLVLKKCPRPHPIVTVSFTLDGVKSTSCTGDKYQTVEVSLPDGILTISLQ